MLTKCSPKSGQMNKIETDIDDLFVIEPSVFEDSRGYFFESYNKETFKEVGIDVDFVQDNQSLSQKGVVRGLHFQKPNRSQIKLLRVVRGSILDVAVDIRKNSSTYGKYVSVLLSEKNKKMFYIGHGFAHGFLTLEDDTVVQYKCSDYYSKQHEGALMWNDIDLNIDWGIDCEPVVSEKDKNNLSFKNFDSPFV